MQITTVNVLLYPGFELLDAMGPIELLAQVPGLEVRTASLPQPDDPGRSACAPIVPSAQGVRVCTDVALPHPCDLLLVPGGIGAREIITQDDALAQIRTAAEHARIVASVCTGSALLAAAGLLDGYQATSNKQAFDWASAFGESVDWVYPARWVHDRDRWTSSGVAAGMDMTAALIRHVFGPEVYEAVLNDTEYSPVTDPDHDPFAVASRREDDSYSG